jgi:hypothetical protein
MTSNPTGTHHSGDVEELRERLAQAVTIAIALFLASFVLGAVAGWGAGLVGRKPLSALVMVASALIGLGIVIWRYYLVSRPMLRD